MEIHGGGLNGTKCLIVILTNGGNQASPSDATSAKDASSSSDQHNNLPHLLSSLLNYHRGGGGGGSSSSSSINSSSLKLITDLNQWIMNTGINGTANMSNLTNDSAITPSPITDEFHFNDVDYTLDIVLPLIVGLVVALILGWMLIRYKMSAHQRSNYNGSIYCCPEECYMFCARFFKCNLRGFKWPKLKKRSNQNNINNSISNNDRPSFVYNPSMFIK